MTDSRRTLMVQRDQALAAGDIALFQALTLRIAQLPLGGVKALSQRDIDRYVKTEKG